MITDSVRICRFAEKQSTQAYWLKEVQKYDVKILDQTEVIWIVRYKGKSGKSGCSH